MNIKIRNEEPKDYRVVEEIAREALGNLYFPGCHEHFVVHILFREISAFLTQFTIS